MHAATTGKGRALRILLVLALLPALTMVSPAATTATTAITAPRTPFNIDVIGHSGGEIASVETIGNHLLAVRGNALASYDLTSGDAVATGSTLLPDHGGPTAVDGDRYYSAGAHSFSIVNVSDPGMPVYLGSADMPSESYSIVGIFAAGDYVYVGYEKYGYYGMKVFNVSDPFAPFVTAVYSLPVLGSGEVTGTTAYVMVPTGDIHVLDLSAPGRPYKAATLTTADPVAGLCLAGGYLYAATDDGAGAGSLVPFDLTGDPRSPTTGSAFGKAAHAVDAAGDRLWAAHADGTIAAWDITIDPAAPVATHEAVMTGHGVAALDTSGAALISAQENGATVTILADGPDALLTTSTIYSEYGDTAVALTEGWAFIVSPTGVRAVDTSQAALPSMSNVALDGPADIVLSGDASVAFVGTPDGLTVVDVSDPLAIGVLTTLTLGGGLERLVLSDDGSTLYGVAGKAFHAIDIEIPVSPTVLDTATLPYRATGIDADGDRVWVALATSESGGTLQEYDTSVPAALDLLAGHGLPGGNPSVAVDSGYAFTGLTDPDWGGSGVKIFDVSDPGSLWYRFYHPLGRRTATDLTASDGQLLSVGEGGMLLTGVYAPALPYTMGFLPVPGMRVERLGDFIATTKENGGTTFAAYEPVSFRTFGGNRFDTAIAMSQTFDSSKYVVLATARSYPDALAGVPLAYALDAPILLTERDYIPANVAAEIKRLGATKAIVLGGTAALGQGIATQLRGMGFAASNIERIYGPTRYGTARAIAMRLELIKGDGAIDKVFVATGANFPDALAVAGVAARSGCPILLVKPGDRNVDAHAAINALGASDSVVVGGATVVTPQVMATLPSPERLAGTTRFDTAVVIAKWAMNDPVAAFSASELFVVTGLNFPDALSSGVVSAANAAPTLLMSDARPTATLTFVRQYGSEIDSVSIIGGTAAVSSEMERWIVAYAASP